MSLHCRSLIFDKHSTELRVVKIEKSSEFALREIGG